MKRQLLLFLSILYVSFVYAQVPELWGTMSTGSTYGIGGIIKINGDGTGYTKVYACMGDTAGGSMQGNFLPYGNTLLYGVTVSGGPHALGDVYSYNTLTNTYTSLFSMDSASGFYPRGSITMADNNKLYGLTSNGGMYDAGVFFSLDPANNQYEKLHDFDITTGQYPNGSVTQSSVNNKLFGMTTSGGANSSGVIFSYDITGTVFSIVHDFDFTSGFAPFGTLLDGSDGLLYGMAFGGGSTGYGVIFSLDPTNNNFTVIHTFDGINGSVPYNSTLTESSGFLYGCTSQGGTDNKGVLFSLDLANNAYTKLHDFTQATGSSPFGGVIKASDGKLYGMTLNGGANDLGAIFSFDLQTSIYTKIFDGSFTDGGFPYADLLEYTAPTGIDQVDVLLNNVQIFPVPSNGSITVRIADFKHDVTFTVTNNLNQRVFEDKLTSASTSLNLNLQPGIYFYSINDNHIRSSGKMVIQ